MSWKQAAVKKGTTRIIKVDRGTANKIIKRLKAAGVTDPYALEAIEKLGSARYKAANAELAERFIDQLRQLKDGTGTVAGGPSFSSCTRIHRARMPGRSFNASIKRRRPWASPASAAPSRCSATRAPT